MPRIRVITFDLDNTLWDLTTVIADAERRMVAWLDEQVPEAATLYRDGSTVPEIRAGLIEEQPAIVHDVSRLREELLYRCMGRAGFAEAPARDLARRAFTLFLDARHEVEFFTGAFNVLERLSRNYRLGSLTNGNADPKRLKLDRYFAFSFSAASVGASKPAPAMFEKVLSHNGVRAHETIHVGDHPVDDIEGAANVGMHTIWTRGPHQRTTFATATRTEPTLKIEQLDELEDAVRAIEELP